MPTDTTSSDVPPHDPIALLRHQDWGALIAEVERLRSWAAAGRAAEEAAGRRIAELEADRDRLVREREAILWVACSLWIELLRLGNTD